MVVFTALHCFKCVHCIQPELTADQFASYYALGLPFLIAFVNVGQLSSTKSSLMSVMDELASNMGPFDGKVVPAWMDM